MESNLGPFDPGARAAMLSFFQGLLQELIVEKRFIPVAYELFLSVVDLET